MRPSAEIQSCAERLIDLDYYNEKSGEFFKDKGRALIHFSTFGQDADLNPSPFFYTKWYRWQNYTQQHVSVLHHFVERAHHKPIDPAPMIDSVGFLQANVKYQNMIMALIALTEKRDTSVSPNIADHYKELSLNQSRVHGLITSSVIRRQLTARKRLVWVQAGSKFSTTAWFRPDEPRSWDLMCNWYTNAGVDILHGEVHLLQPGTKSTAIHHVLCEDPELLAHYEQILFLDDDISVTHNDIDRLFDVAQHEQLEMFQASLLPNSYCAWPDLIKKNGSVTRQTTGVEIMMPGFTRNALFSSRDLFGRSVSGFGLDFLVSETLIQAGKKIGVVDAISFGHYSSIDEGTGEYYRLMRALGINQKLELYEIIEQLGRNPSFCDR